MKAMTKFVASCIPHRTRLGSAPSIIGISRLPNLRRQFSSLIALALTPYVAVDAFDAAARIHRAVVDGMSSGIL